MLYDGAVTLDGTSNPVPIELSEQLVVNSSVTITFGDDEYNGAVEDFGEGAIGVQISTADGTIGLANMDGDDYFYVSSPSITAGEYNLKIVQYES